MTIHDVLARLKSEPQSGLIDNGNGTFTFAPAAMNQTLPGDATPTCGCCEEESQYYSPASKAAQSSMEVPVQVQHVANNGAAGLQGGQGPPGGPPKDDADDASETR